MSKFIVDQKKIEDLKKEHKIVRINNFNIDNIEADSFEDLTDLEDKQMNFILHPWLPEQGIAIIYSATGIGKTWFTLNCAYAISRGGNYLKYSAPIPKKVLYIDGEMARQVMSNRCKQIRKEQGTSLVKNNFIILSHEKIMPNFLPRLNDLSGQEFYLSYIEKHNFDVIVFDNFSVLTDIDENLSEQWAPIIKFLLTLRAMGKTVIGVHHCGKNKYEYRGSSKMMDIVDTSILLTSNKGDQLENEFHTNASFKISYKKDRVLNGKDAVPFNVNYDGNKWTIQSAENANLHYVVDAIKNKISQTMIANELGVSRQYISKLVKIAKETNLIIE